MIRLEERKQPTRRAGGRLGFEVRVAFRDESWRPSRHKGVV